MRSDPQQAQHRAQRLFAHLLASPESARRMLDHKWFETAIGYKVDWEKKLQRREELGITSLPDPLSYPDHIEIDLDRGQRHWDGRDWFELVCQHSTGFSF